MPIQLHVHGIEYNEQKIAALLNDLASAKKRAQKTTGQLCLMAHRYLFEDITVDDKIIEYISRLLGTSPLEAIYIVRFLQKALQSPGDVCEFGVAQGRTSALLAHIVKNTDRSLWLYDSFEGLPAPHEKDVLIHDIFRLGDMKAYRGKMACPEDQARNEVLSTGIEPERCHIIKGWVEESLVAGKVPPAICFMYLDCDFYSPTIAALNAFHERSKSGACAVLDDYGHFSSGVETAVTEFLSTRPDYTLLSPIPGAGSFRVLVRL